ncbi:MAG: branched-chain amino acid ABC transporter permease [Rubrivivax sp.]|nr:branched-chain amino acid ABC transporter permease [Rubrivivax sp.]
MTPPAARHAALPRWLPLAVAALVALPLVPGGYVLYIASLVLVYTLASFGTNILTGYTNLISLAGATFFGIGAYGSAILSAKLGLPLPLAMLGAAAVAALLGVLLAVPVLRLEEAFLAIATLGFVMVFMEIAKGGGALTGGESGMAAPAPRLFGIALGERGFYVFIVVVLLVGLWMARNLSDSRFGRGFLALKGSEIAARSLGLNAPRLKLTAFGLCAFYTGVAGALFAPLVRFVDPSVFDIMVSISFVSMVIIGGLGSVWGSVLGAVFVAGAPQLLTYVGLDNVQRSLYGAAMILSLVFLPDGLVSLFRKGAR